MSSTPVSRRCLDAINVKIREGQVANRPIYLALGVTVDGERDVLGLWAGEHGDGEGAKFWLRVCSEIKNRGTRDVLMVVCDGLKGLPDAVNSVWEKAIVQTCIVHFAAEFVQVRVEAGLGADRERPQAGLLDRVRRSPDAAVFVGAHRRAEAVLVSVEQYEALQEAAERQHAVAAALASVRAEGLEPSAEDLALFAEVAAGRLSTDELRERVLSPYRR